MNTRRTVALAVLAVVLVAAAGVAAIGFLFQSADRASYTANTSTAFDYDAVLQNAEVAGYGVERVGGSGFHPEGVPALDDELGAHYEVSRVVFYHERGGRLDADVFADEGVTQLTYWGPDFEPVTAETLPEAWLVDRIQFVLGVDEATARGYVDEMRASITDDDIPVPQASASDDIDFAAAYDEFAGQPRNVTAGQPGQGWVEYHYANASIGEPTGELHFVVGRAEITHTDDGLRYVLDVDRNGGVGVTVLGPAGEEVSDARLRDDLRELFASLGIPPSAVDGLSFEYDPSVW